MTDLPFDAARLRITLTYLWRHGRLPCLTRPTRFNELVQVRKLLDRDPRMPLMADKVAVKALVAERLGRAWVIPMLWSGEELPVHCPWQTPVVVKSRGGCKQNAFIRGGASDWAAARYATRRWMAGHYGAWLDEWLYREIPRGLLIEPLIGSGAGSLVDYKIYVFGGEATHVQVHLDRDRDHRWIVHDRGWRAVADGAPTIARPSALAAMLAAAEDLAAGFDFARVDFYQPAEQPLFGEITFYPGSGLDPFDPPSLDEELGALWLAAAGNRQASERPRLAQAGSAALSLGRT